MNHGHNRCYVMVPEVKFLDFLDFLDFLVFLVIWGQLRANLGESDALAMPDGAKNMCYVMVTQVGGNIMCYVIV